MDLNQKGLEFDSAVEASLIQKKSCADCQTTRTPLWRSGPAGPRSLCNACGIRHRKQRRALLGLGNGGSEKIKKKKIVDGNGGSSSSSSSNEMGGALNLEMVELGSEMVLQRSNKKVKKQRRKLREEEEAAMLLMAMSCGSVFG